jgi:hypothetical protein
MQTFEFLRQPLLGKLVMSWRERERKRRRKTFIVATYVYTNSQGQRTHSAWTKIVTLGAKRSISNNYCAKKSPV